MKLLARLWQWLVGLLVDLLRSAPHSADTAPQRRHTARDEETGRYVVDEGRFRFSAQGPLPEQKEDTR